MPDISNSRSGVSSCIAVTGSMTGAMKAQSILASAAIHSTVTKVSSSKNSRGCVYGVSFPCIQERNVKVIFDNAGFRVRGFIDK